MRGAERRRRRPAWAAVLVMVGLLLSLLVAETTLGVAPSTRSFQTVGASIFDRLLPPVR